MTGAWMKSHYFLLSYARMGPVFIVAYLPGNFATSDLYFICERKTPLKASPSHD